MDLEPVEQRILGSLLEKQVTVPASYPLTLSSLRTACNQTSSREPVMELDERTVEQTARALNLDPPSLLTTARVSYEESAF